MDQTPKKNTGIGSKFLLSTAAIIVILAGLKAAQSLIAPMLLAVFFALVLLPPLRLLKQKGLPDWVAILVLSAIVLLGGIGVVSILGGSLTNFAKRLPEYQEKLGKNLDAADDLANELISKFGQMETSLKGALPNFKSENDSQKPVTELTPDGEDPSATEGRFSFRNAVQLDVLMKYVQTGVKDLLNIATVSFLVAVMVIFMLVEASNMPAKVRAAFGGRDLSNEYFKRIADDTWQYTKIKTIVSLLTGVATTIVLWLLGIEYSLLWGLLMFFLNYIPNIGPIIASVPPILLALVDQGATMAVVVTFWLIVVNFLFGYGVEPRYLGEGLGISSLVVLLSLIVWGWLIGPIGMFLSAPLTMVFKIVLQNDPKTEWIGTLLGNGVPEKEPKTSVRG